MVRRPLEHSVKHRQPRYKVTITSQSRHNHVTITSHPCQNRVATLLKPRRNHVVMMSQPQRLLLMSNCGYAIHFWRSAFHPRHSYAIIASQLRTTSHLRHDIVAGYRLRRSAARRSQQRQTNRGRATAVRVGMRRATPEL